MSRRRLLTDDQAEELYQEYLLWLSLAPRNLCKKYGIARQAFHWYSHRKHKTRKAA